MVATGDSAVHKHTGNCPDRPPCTRGGTLAFTNRPSHPGATAGARCVVSTREAVSAAQWPVMTQPRRICGYPVASARTARATCSRACSRASSARSSSTRSTRSRSSSRPVAPSTAARSTRRARVCLLAARTSAGWPTRSVLLTRLVTALLSRSYRRERHLVPLQRTHRAAPRLDGGVRLALRRLWRPQERARRRRGGTAATHAYPRRRGLQDPGSRVRQDPRSDVARGSERA